MSMTLDNKLIIALVRRAGGTVKIPAADVEGSLEFYLDLRIVNGDFELAAKTRRPPGNKR